MSSNNFSYGEQPGTQLPDASEMRIGIVVCEWNNDITDALLENAVETLKASGVSEHNINVERVPGSFELIFGCNQMAKYGFVDGIIAIGCVIKGDTPHFDYICMGTTQGLASLNMQGNIPVINGLLTVNTHQQAVDRTNGTSGNKGKEFAITAIKMIDYAWQFKK